MGQLLDILSGAWQFLTTLITSIISGLGAIFQIVANIPLFFATWGTISVYFPSPFVAGVGVIFVSAFAIAIYKIVRG
ncbi:hypothetical protein FACS18949_08930 [Clostridia bacterium]|nr:hypothetical protein FACS18949_08930 [Clostridia bacterium]